MQEFADPVCFKGSHEQPSNGIQDTLTLLFCILFFSSVPFHVLLHVFIDLNLNLKYSKIQTTLYNACLIILVSKPSTVWQELYKAENYIKLNKIMKDKKNSNF